VFALYFTAGQFARRRADGAFQRLQRQMARHYYCHSRRAAERFLRFYALRCHRMTPLTFCVRCEDAAQPGCSPPLLQTYRRHCCIVSLFYRAFRCATVYFCAAALARHGDAFAFRAGSAVPATRLRCALPNRCGIAIAAFYVWNSVQALFVVCGCAFLRRYSFVLRICCYRYSSILSMARRDALLVCL